MKNLVLCPDFSNLERERSGKGENLYKGCLPHEEYYV